MSGTRCGIAQGICCEACLYRGRERREQSRAGFRRVRAGDVCSATHHSRHWFLSYSKLRTTSRGTTVRPIHQLSHLCVLSSFRKQMNRMRNRITLAARQIAPAVISGLVAGRSTLSNPKKVNTKNPMNNTTAKAPSNLARMFIAA